MFKDIPVDVGVIYEGERIRWAEAQMELGGPRIDRKFELVRVKSLDEIKDGETKIIGPDIKDMEKSSYPIGIYIEVAGKEAEEELEGVIERRIHEYCNFIEGLMHVNQRYDIHLRLSEKSYKKGLNSFNIIGKILYRLFKSELPFLEKVQITFITEKEKVDEMYEMAMNVYEERDSKARGLKDEDVEEFYGCNLCQSFAPTHSCVITPQRYANCGAISWFDGRAAARVDPRGPIFKMAKGECLDPLKGEYEGANESLKKNTMGEITRVWLYTAFGYPHTSCGCFEGVAFYIPEVDGLGIVHRGFKEPTVNGLPFSVLADSTAGGRQVDGFHGISFEYMRSTKFLQVDGGWNRIVWMPVSAKERVKNFIPQDVVDKIATEKDASTVEELKVFLETKEHPVVERWKAAPVKVPAEEEKVEVPMEVSIETEALISTPLLTTTPVAGGFKIILKNAKIHAKKVYIRRRKD
jgi:acetyl-CoA decarbonylase/synthase complex subunit beta